MDTPTFEQLDEMGKAIRARLVGKPEEWGAIDEPARKAYRLAASDVLAIYSAQLKQCAGIFPQSPDDALLPASNGPPRIP